MTHTPAYLAHKFAVTIDARDWSGLREILAPECRVHFVHDNKKFNRDEWVAFNADYPGQWSFVTEDIVATDSRAVVRARVFNETTIFHVASFLSAKDGLINDIVEVWADGHPSAAEE